MRAALAIAAAVVAAIVVLVLLFLALESAPALREIGLRRFVTDDRWRPADDAASGSFGLVPMLAGSAAATLGAILVAAPLGVIAAIFGVFCAPPVLARAYRRLVELLAGIPSVVYGFWGLTTLAPLIRRLEPPGTSLLTGIIVLAIMILPTVTLLSAASMRGVPAAHLRAAAALGLSRGITVIRIVLPAARGGIGVALVLAVARAVGETMAVLMVCGNVAKVPTSLFDPVRTLTANIALELGYAAGLHRSALFVGGLALMALIVGLVVVTELAGRRERLDG